MRHQGEENYTRAYVKTKSLEAATLLHAQSHIYILMCIHAACEITDTAMPEPEIVLKHKETSLFSWDFTSSTFLLCKDVGSAPVSQEPSVFVFLIEFIDSCFFLHLRLFSDLGLCASREFGIFGGM